MHQPPWLHFHVIRQIKHIQNVLAAATNVLLSHTFTENMVSQANSMSVVFHPYSVLDAFGAQLLTML